MVCEKGVNGLLTPKDFCEQIGGRDDLHKGLHTLVATLGPGCLPL